MQGARCPLQSVVGRSLKGLGNTPSISPGPLWGEDAGGCTRLCHVLPAVPGVSIFPAPPWLLFTDYASFLEQEEGGGGTDPPCETFALGEHWRCQTHATSPLCIAEEAWYKGGQSSAHTVQPQQVSPAGIQPPTFQILCNPPAWRVFKPIGYAWHFKNDF